MITYLNLTPHRKPRASGDDPRSILIPDELPRVNPARAGMIRTMDENEIKTGGKPRASGDDPYTPGSLPCSSA